MPLEILDLFGEDPPATAPPREHEVTPERVVAVLRWRARASLRRLPRRLADAVRVFPALLAAASTHRLLRGEPPGLAVRLRPHSIARVSREFGLPPPGAAARRRLVRALLVVTAQGHASVLACLDPSASAGDVALVADRLARIQEFLGTHGLRVDASTTNAASVSATSRAISSLAGSSTLRAAAWP